MSGQGSEQTIWDRDKNSFDGLRLILATLVIYSHSFPLALGNESREPLWRATHGQLTFGRFAVDCFFIISGYLITASMLRSRSAIDFLKRRIQRIYPGFFVANLMGAFLFGPIGHANAIPQASRRFLNCIFETLRLREFSYSLAFTANPAHGVNGSMWTIPYEFYCYLLVLVLSVTLALKRPLVVAAGFALIVIASVIWQVSGFRFDSLLIAKTIGVPDDWAHLLPFFLAGMVFYLFRSRIPLQPWLCGVAMVGLFLASFVPFGWAITFPILGPYLIFALALQPCFGFDRVTRYGDFSYGLYLYAYPIQQTIVQSFGVMPPWKLFLLSLPAAFSFAVLSWNLVERPFLRRARRKVALSLATRKTADVQRDGTFSGIT